MARVAVSTLVSYLHHVSATFPSHARHIPTTPASHPCLHPRPIHIMSRLHSIHYCKYPEPRASLEQLKPKGGSPKTLSPPPQTKEAIMRKSELYHRENLVGPVLIHKLLGPKPPLPRPPHSGTTPNASPRVGGSNPKNGREAPTGPFLNTLSSEVCCSAAGQTMN